MTVVGSSRWWGARLGQLAVTLSVVLLLLFVLVELAPGGPLTDPGGAEEFVVDACVRDMNLERPVAERLVEHLATLGFGWTGRSWKGPQCATVVSHLQQHLPASLQLMTVAMLVATGGGVLLGVWQAARAGPRLDPVLTVALVTLQSAPSFVIALGLAWIGWQLDLDPMATGLDAGWRSFPRLLLHSLAVSLGALASFSRLTRTAAGEVLGSELVRALAARGLSAGRVLWRHVLPLSLGPAIQLLGLALPGWIGGAMIVESFFGRNGMGVLLLAHVRAQDLPVISVVSALIAAATWAGGVMAELLAAAVDPRQRERP